MLAGSTVPTGKTGRVTIESGAETIEPNNEPLGSGARKMKTDLVEAYTPVSEMQCIDKTAISSE